jgi:hypothetical protein
VFSVILVGSGRVTAGRGGILLADVAPLPRIDVVLGCPSVSHADGGHFNSETYFVLVHKVHSGPLSVTQFPKGQEVRTVRGCRDLITSLRGASRQEIFLSRSVQIHI